METQCNAPQDVPSVDRGGYRERGSEWVFVGAEGGEGGVEVSKEGTVNLLEHWHDA